MKCIVEKQLVMMTDFYQDSVYSILEITNVRFFANRFDVFVKTTKVLRPKLI